jgi:hypothetical protein
MFENQTDAATAIDAAIRSAIEIWIPEVNVETVNVSSFDPNGAVGVEINVSLPDFTSTSISILSTTLNPDATTTR